MKNKSPIILLTRNNQHLHLGVFLADFFSAHMPVYVYLCLQKMSLYNTYQFVIDLNKLQDLL